ncbi:hypothetical protein JCM10212_002292 [Sporobolomyces blumeae]
MAPRVTIAYETLPNASDYDAVRHDVERQLPLRNLHWVRKNVANRSVRTVNDLAVEFKPLNSYPPVGNGDSLLLRPYLSVLFVVCDDNEVYRATIRSQIREWLDGVTVKQHQEWLIVHVTSGKSGGAKFYQRKSGIVDKVKTDFNVGKKDRCIQVAQGASADDPTAWAEFSNKVKEGLISTFDSIVTLYEENVRKADSQRQLEGWNFLPFFLQKESLADSFEAMTLFEEALIQYDELEASFFQALKENRISWINNVGGLSPGDDASPLLSTENKPYRDLIGAGSISVFDFRIYLFARQAAMLFKLGRIVEVARRGAFFVSTFARTLREHQNLLGQNFVESWTYSACHNIVETCEKAFTNDAPAIGFVAVKAELLELAKKQLDKIGMGAGHLPMVHPFSMSLNETSPPRPTSPSTIPPSDRPPVSRRDLIEATSNRDVFDKLYVELSQKTIQAYQSSGRKRCAIKLHAGLAGLEHHRSRPAAAQKLFSQLPAHYVDLRWVQLESYLLSQCTSLQSTLDMPKERLLSTLALVRSGVEFGAKEWTMPSLHEDGDGKEKDAELAKKLMEDVHELSTTLSKDFAAISFPTFSVRLAPGTGERAPDEDGVVASALVRNLLPTDLQVDEVRLKFSTHEGDQVWFTSGKTKLCASGETAVSLFCPSAATGRLSLELSQLRFSRIIFQYSHRPISSRNLAPDPRLAPMQPDMKQPSITLEQDYQAVQVEIEAVETIHLDRERQVVVRVDPGRNTVNKMTIHLEMHTPSMQIDPTRAKLAGTASGSARLATGSTATSLVVENLKPFKPVKVELPLTGEILDPLVSFTILVEYSTSRRPTLRRTLRRTFSHSVGLPLAVNVQDYFREDCLLSKFSITTDGLRALKVKSAALEAPKEVAVKACRNPAAPPVTISSVQTANFLFKLFCEDPSKIEGSMRLVLRYASVEDQLVARLQAIVAVAVGETLVPHARWFTSTVIRHVLRAVDIRRYSNDQDLSGVELDEDVWREELGRYTSKETERDALRETLRQIYKELASSRVDPSSQTWKRLEIPLDLPALSILNLVTIAPTHERVEVGQAVPTEVRLRSLTKWRRHALHDKVKLRYEVVANPTEWVVNGETRGDFEVTGPESQHSFSLSLVPLLPSALFLPSISIVPLNQAVPSQEARVTCETQHVAAATTVEVMPVLMKSSWETRRLDDVMDGVDAVGA